MISIGEEKRTKDLIRKNGVFSANLVSEQLLPLADYYGCTYGRITPDKMKCLQKCWIQRFPLQKN